MCNYSKTHHWRLRLSSDRSLWRRRRQRRASTVDCVEEISDLEPWRRLDDNSGIAEVGRDEAWSEDLHERQRRWLVPATWRRRLRARWRAHHGEDEHDCGDWHRRRRCWRRRSSTNCRGGSKRMVAVAVDPDDPDGEKSTAWRATVQIDGHKEEDDDVVAINSKPWSGLP